MLFAQLCFSSGTAAAGSMQQRGCVRTTDILSAAAMFLRPQKLTLKSVQGGTSLRESLKAGLIFRASRPQLMPLTRLLSLNPLKQV